MMTFFFGKRVILFCHCHYFYFFLEDSIWFNCCVDFLLCCCCCCCIIVLLYSVHVPYPLYRCLLLMNKWITTKGEYKLLELLLTLCWAEIQGQHLCWPCAELKSKSVPGQHAVNVLTLCWILLSFAEFVLNVCWVCAEFVMSSCQDSDVCTFRFYKK